MKGKLGKGIIIWIGVWCFLVSVRADQVTGGLSWLWWNGLSVTVEGGVIRRVRDAGGMFIWLLAPEAHIMVEAQGQPPAAGRTEVAPGEESAAGEEMESEAGPPFRLSLAFGNLPDGQVKFVGEGDFVQSGRQATLEAVLAPGERREFWLCPQEEPESFTFAVVGESREGHAVFSRIISRLNQKRPHFAVNCGDLTPSGKRFQYRYLDAQLTEARFPFYLVLGNQDVRWWGRAVYQEFFGPSYYSFDYGPGHFVILDNALGRIDSRQFQWLVEDMRRNTRPYIFWFMHLPPFDPRPDKFQGMTSRLNAGQLMRLAAEYRVSRVFCSHIPGYYEEVRQ